MKTIEEVIKENRSAIERIEPMVGHRERMQARLAQASATNAVSAIATSANDAAANAVSAIATSANVAATVCSIAKKRRQLRTFWVSTACAAAAVIALALWIIPISSTEPAQTILTAQQIEAIEVEKYYRSQRDRAIDEVCEILKQKPSEAAAQISYGIAELKLTFEAEPLSKSLFFNDTERYIALTIARYTAQTEVIEELKKTVTNI